MSEFINTIAKKEVEIKKVIQNLEEATTHRDITALRCSVHELNSLQKEIDDTTRVKSSIEDLERFMFAYREIHRTGKMQSLIMMMNLYSEVKTKNLWINPEGIQNKQVILNSLGMNIISYGINIIEDFLSFSYCLSYELDEIANRMIAYRDLNRILKHVDLLQNNYEECCKTLQLLSDDEVRKLSAQLFSNKDKEIIIGLQRQNVEAFQHVLRYAIKFYKTYRDANNKYKHGFPFLFALSMDFNLPSLKEISPCIPYFGNGIDIKTVSSVFIGDKVINQLHNLLLTKNGGLFQIIWSLATRVSIRCRCEGKRLIAPEYWGKTLPPSNILEQYEKFAKVYIDQYCVLKEPKQMELKIASNIEAQKWIWLNEDWQYK